MPQKILFSDIDGTLLDARRELSDQTITEIQRIKDNTPFVLISSRMPEAMYHLQKTLSIESYPLICYNGGLILIDQKVVSSTSIPVEIIEKLHTFSLENPCHISLYNQDDWFVPTMDYWAKREMNNTKVVPTVQPISKTLTLWKSEDKGAHKIMCMGEEKTMDAVFEFLENTYGTELHLYRSKPTYIEIANKSVSKLTAIQFLLTSYFQKELKDIVAFGDNYNDMEMLKSAGIGVAVANAKPEVLAIANRITASGKENGVAIFINENF